MGDYLLYIHVTSNTNTHNMLLYEYVLLYTLLCFTQTREIVKSMFLGALSDIGAIVLLLVNLCLVYRAGGLIQRLRKASIVEWKKCMGSHCIRPILNSIQDIINSYNVFT